MLGTITQLATAVALTAAMTIAMPTWADESQTLAQAGRATWFGMMCAEYADAAGRESEESKRLMEYGYT
jgi:hypothetical protein